MSNTTDTKFEWTDELVGEFLLEFINKKIYPATITRHHLTPVDVELLKSFKQSKQSSPTPQPPLYKEQGEHGWEILRFQYESADNCNFVLVKPDGNCYYDSPMGSLSGTLENHLRSDSKWLINKVRRKSDGVVFSVGDELDFQWKSIYVTGSKNIKSFNIENNELYINGDDWTVTLASAKTKQPKPSPIQEDKPEIKLPLSQIKHLYDIWATNYNDKQPFMEFLYSRVIF